MTRINVIEPKFLLDQHLMAEYRELPMVGGSLRRSLKAKKFPNIPRNYTLNNGHVTFFYNKRSFLEDRYQKLISELLSRNYEISPETRKDNFEVFSLPDKPFFPSLNDVRINLERILSRYSDKPHFYRYKGKKIDYINFLNENGLVI